jgi:hypothetical protein
MLSILSYILIGVLSALAILYRFSLPQSALPCCLRRGERAQDNTPRLSRLFEVLHSQDREDLHPLDDVVDVGTPIL